MYKKIFGSKVDPNVVEAQNILSMTNEELNEFANEEEVEVMVGEAMKLVLESNPKENFVLDRNNSIYIQRVSKDQYKAAANITDDNIYKEHLRQSILLIGDSWIKHKHEEVKAALKLKATATDESSDSDDKKKKKKEKTPKNQREEKDQEADPRIDSIVFKSTDISHAEKIAAALAYEGFSSKKVREIVRAKNMPTRVIVEILTTYIMIGNNIKNAAIKRSDVEEGRRMQELLRSYGIVSKPAKPEDLSMPRMAIAYAPLLLRIRKQLSSKNKLPLRLAVEGPDYLHDLAFNGFRDLPAFKESKSFILKMSQVIFEATAQRKKSGEVPKFDPEEVERWHETGAVGRKEDKILDEICSKTDPTLSADISRLLNN
jgi:hypothetical protein